MSAILALKLKDYELRPRGFDWLWRVIRELGQGAEIFTIKDIEHRTKDQSFNDTRDYVRRLEKANILECVGQVSKGGWKGAKRYKLLSAPKVTPSITRDGKQTFRHRSKSQMWTAIRTLERFSKHDIALTASTEECPVPLDTAAQYLYRLRKAGYFVILQEARPHQPAYYRLRPDMKTGPLPPRILSTNVVYDQNRNKIYGEVEFREVTA